MKKHLALLLVVVMILTTLASCDYSTTMVEAQFDYEITSSSTSYTVGVGATLDLKSLFEIKNITTGEEVAVTDEMITSEVNFSVPGMYTVTCTIGSTLKSVIIIVTKYTDNGANIEDATTSTTESGSEPAEESSSQNAEGSESEEATGGSEESTTTREEEHTTSEVSATIDFADKNNMTGQNAAQQVWEQNGIILVNDKASSQSDVVGYAPIRLYKASEVSITVEGGKTITTVVITPDVSQDPKYGTALYNSIEAAGYDITTSGDDYIVTVNDTEFYFALTAQGRIESMTVNYLTSGSGSSGGSSGGGTSNAPYTSGIEDKENGVGTSQNSPLHKAMQDYIEENPNNENQLAIGLPAQGTYSALIIPVQFSNDKFTQDELSDLEIAFNGTSAQTGWQSVSSYYKTSSFGKLNLSFDIANPITMPNRSSSYETGDDAAQDILDYALDTIDDTLDLSNYDTNGDGYIDAVYLIYSVAMDYDSDESNYWAFVTWHFESDTYDGVKAHYYLFASVDFMYEEIEGADNGYEGLKINAATYIHETGHLLGLDDYYDYNVKQGSDEGLGGADMMDYTIGDQNVYSKLMLGWVTPTIVDSTKTVTISSSAESGQFILVPLDYDGTYFSEYLLIDLYTATGLNEFHGDCDYSYLYFDPNDEYEHGAEYGARIYHVSASIDNPFSDDYFSFTDNNNSMTDTALIKLVEADGDTSFESDLYEGTKYAAADDLWMTGDTLGSVQSGYSASALGFSVTFTSVSANSATVTITFN